MKTDNFWIGISSQPLPVSEAMQWAGSDPGCGAVVSFAGNARNSPGRLPDGSQSPEGSRLLNADEPSPDQKKEPKTNPENELGAQPKEVTALMYEAFESEVLPRLEALARKVIKKWPDIARLALLHRTGTLQTGETAVLVIAAAPHRQSAFEAAKYGIDTLKATMPIWKKEIFEDGESWGLTAQHIEEL